MKLLKPNWVSHDDFPIFSVDIHPDGKRFATGGQACVNCVRWSAGGLLASGGDDKVIMIWRYHGSGGSASFGGKPSVESWRCVSTLRCHEGDVLDLAWAPHSPWLASASVDNSIIIWDASNFPNIIAILKGHTGLVKGVTWDPVGKYLASQSDDKSLKVWSTTDWSETTSISDPFVECGGTTHVLRLSWSPDGQYLVSAHAMNGGGPTAQIIERGNWTYDKDFVGHRKAVTCVRFNSNIFQKKQGGSSKAREYCCLAIGSRDRALSVWLTSLKRPLMVINELFTHSVLDASWSPCGLRLAACSWDGTVAFMEFTQQELGRPLNPEEQSLVHGGFTVMEAPVLLNMKPPAPTTQSQPAQPVSNGFSPSVSSSPSPIKAPINKQIEMRTSDGRRRITPMFIPPPPDTVNSSESTDTTAAIKNTPTFSSTSQTKSSIVIEKRDDVVAPNVTTTTNMATPSTSAPGLTLKRRDPTTARPNHHHHHHHHHSRKPRLVNDKQGSIVFPALKPVGSLSHQAAHYAVTVTNNQNLAHLQVFRGTDSEPTWNLHLGYSAVALAASAAVIAVGLEDGSIHTFDPTKGSRPAPPLAPPAPLAKLHAVGNAVMVISCCGAVRVWEIGSTSKLIVSTSASHLAAFGGASTLVGSRTPRGPLSSLQEALNRTAGGIMPSPRPPHNGSSIVSYLEQQLLASKALGSQQEYIHWFMALISFLLTQDGLEKRLRIMLDDLMGPSHSTAAKSTWDPMILGIRKHKLLADALGVIGGHLRWQRLYLEYSEQLASLKS
ncbi:Similar to Hira: Protein HIRA homolog (Drosophila melanogaster) [Cotesia congregata]|uniref:Protein HIRA n=1 Tax=Cotesia congregata TaxID=51543 RepID=A0A8J2MVY1_COTCN|nr:Similar to Hira: Protein HIRA homolog (Drosophila melanogaster) [Cotesia congregata]